MINNFASSSSGLSALGISWSAFLIQLITFALAFIVLKKYAVKPIIKLLDDRRAKIEQGVTLGDSMVKKEEELEVRISQQLHQARIKADQIIADAEVSAQSIVKEAEDKAVFKTDVLFKEAKEKINFESNQLRQQLESDVLSLISQTSGTILKKKLDSKEDQLLIAKTLKEEQASYYGN